MEGLEAASAARNRFLAILGAPIEDGAGIAGAAMGPAMLRVAGLNRELAALGYEVEDRGDLSLASPLAPAPPPPGMARNFERVAAWTGLLREKTYEALSAGRTPIVIGGDHSLAMGSIAGAARHAREIGRELFVLWLDAHTDFNTPATSPSGNMHGMPAAMLCGEAGFEGLLAGEPSPILPPGNLHLFGVRSIDEGERRLLRARGVEVADMRVLDEYGAAATIRRIVERVAARRGLLHVSLDLDVLDPQLAPGVGTPVPGGLTFREAHLAMELLHDSGLVGSVDLVELNPFLDERGRSAILLVDLVASLFGRTVF
jgi:arginase